MKTQFAAWLEARGESVHGYAKRHGYYVPSVRRMAGGTAPATGYGFRRAFVDAIAAESGISAETLISEAIAASHEPTPPRPYRRKPKETQDGKAAE